MRRYAKVDRNPNPDGVVKALRELDRRVVQNRRDFPRKGYKLAHELMKGFEKRRLDIRKLKPKKSY